MISFTFCTLKAMECTETLLFYCLINIPLDLALKKCMFTKISLFSRGTKVVKMLTLAPGRYTAGFCMVAKVIQWCI